MLKDLTGIGGMPKLEMLYVADNEIETLEGMGDLPKLRRLHLRKNKISQVVGERLPSFPRLEYLNLRENEALAEPSALVGLNKYPKLHNLNILGNNLG